MRYGSRSGRAPNRRTDRLDRFGQAARAYATFRPHYPDALFDFVTSLAPGTRLAWDCGTGSGQAAVALAARFERVIATDTSAPQLDAAARHDRVRYVRAAAERAPIVAGSVDLVTAAQALHWFDGRAFFGEVRRVLGPGGAVAVWTYDLPAVGPGIDELLHHYYTAVVGPYWAPERRHVESGYDALPFPFEETAVPPLEIAAELSLPELLGYVGTWSASLAYRKHRGESPIGALRESILPLWPDARVRRVVRWPLTVRAGHV